MAKTMEGFEAATSCLGIIILGIAVSFVYMLSLKLG